MSDILVKSMIGNLNRTKIPREAIGKGLLISLACLLSVLVLPPQVQTSRAHEPSFSQATTASSIDRIALHQTLLDLASPWTVMCVAAHPDDEDGTTLTILRRKYGVHTVSLFSTYGEGGQNAVGPELYEELGVIRARETIEASQIQGSEPHFLGLRDFGFSKTADETFRIWGHDEALRRLVLKIRELRPDVIITNHDTSRGHGHHQATGQLILEAFDAAANSSRYPEQLKTLHVWQPQRLFVRVRSSSTSDSSARDAERVVAIDPNERDPVRGTIYAEQALAALQKHATQGPWPKSIADRLRSLNDTSRKLPLIRYALVRESKGASSLPREAKTVLDGLTLPPAVGQRILPPTIEGQSLTEFINQPDRIMSVLLGWRRKAQPLSDASTQDFHRVRLMAERGNRALALASGINLAVNASTPVLVPGVLTNFSVTLSNIGDRSVQISGLSLSGLKEKRRLDVADQLVADTETTVTVNRMTPVKATFTVPRADHLYDGRLFGERFVANANLEIDGARFSLTAETSLDVAPRVEIQSISPTVLVTTPATVGRWRTLDLRLANHAATPFRGQTELAAPYTVKGNREILLQPYETREIEVMPLSPPRGELARGHFRSRSMSLSIRHQNSGEIITTRHLRAVYSDAKVVGDLRVGYLPSYDQTLQHSLTALGVKSKALSTNEIQKSVLAGYDTIVIDNRAYQAHPELIAANSRLLTYVHEGGTLIVFYHKGNEWNPNPDRGRPQLAPYELVLGDERVTEEDAPVKFLLLRHALLNFPNRITQADFENWIQERGLYYPKEWDQSYQALLASADRGEAPLKGGLLVARYGRGNYIYTSMVWYRQLAAGVPGAYRMFANMMSYGHIRRLTRKQPAARSRVQLRV